MAVRMLAKCFAIAGDGWKAALQRHEDELKSGFMNG